MPQHNLKGISSEIYELQLSFLEDMNKTYSILEIQECLKVLQKSVKLWNREHGSRGYLNFISQLTKTKLMKQPPSFLISGTHSGVGKTTASFILMSLFKKMGYQVQPFKHGPDFIDPGYHRLATGRDSINLDFWMMGKQHIIESFNHYIQKAEIGIVEAMGALYDGQNGTGEGSAAHLASLLSLPIIIVVDIYGMTRSVNALIQGFIDFDPTLSMAGIIFNRAGSQKHYDMILDSLLPRFRSLSLGYLPRFSHLSIPERHLGLITAEENVNMTRFSETYLKKNSRRNPQPSASIG